VETRGQVTADQAAELLGVRLQTIYAYVSRGLLTRTRLSNDTGHRVSGFAREEVLRLAAERTRVRLGSLEVLVETDVTLLDPKGALAFRGHPARDLVGWRFEDVAELLWTGDEPAPGRPHRWPAEDADVEVVARAVGSLPHGASQVDRIRVALIALAATDPDRDELGTAHVLAVGRRAILGGVSALRLRGRPVEESIEGALWARLTDRPPRPLELQALRAALILFVDHELAASTMAARITAGTGADPWLVVLTGLAALGGAKHGRSNVLAQELLRTVRRDGLAALESYADQPGVPGFGHKVYVDADPRAEALLDLVAELDPQGWPLVEELLLSVSSAHQQSPNVDFALAALVLACHLPAGAGETIFALSRIVGWVAHGLEEYPQGLRFRPRAVYTGGEH
jgi:citrate synthase